MIFESCFLFKAFNHADFKKTLCVLKRVFVTSQNEAYELGANSVIFLDKKKLICRRTVNKIQQ